MTYFIIADISAHLLTLLLLLDARYSWTRWREWYRTDSWEEIQARRDRMTRYEAGERLG